MNDDTTIRVRYGESLVISSALGDDFPGLNTLKLYVGKPGADPLLEVPATISDGTATFQEESVTLPLGKYSYQVTATYADGTTEKFPSRVSSVLDLPVFEVLEALDETEPTS
ncbi:hypothetical protein [Streptomyces sp. BBFR109]|uniref:hypothetical protein n=1 Tax=Streptomyces sp. BBFR109 TaxID=3448172 RepID=UPI003F757530